MMSADELQAWAEEAVESLPPELRRAMSNVAIVIEEEPPAGMPLLGLYQGVPLTRRSSAYGGAPPDQNTIYRRPPGPPHRRRPAGPRVPVPRRGPPSIAQPFRHH